MKFNSTAIGCIISIIALTGYILNIVKLVDAYANINDTEFTIRLITTIIAPLGCIAGYF